MQYCGPVVFDQLPADQNFRLVAPVQVNPTRSLPVGTERILVDVAGTNVAECRRFAMDCVAPRLRILY